jgi:GT2 family glycosyltransferase
MSKVGIVITAFLPQSLRYLDLCVRSIKALDYPRELLDVVIVTPKGYRPAFDGVTVIHPHKDDYLNGHAMNFGIQAVEKSDYYLYLNDDVILTKDSVKNLVAAARAMSDQAIVMPVGNDAQGKFILNMPIELRPHKYEELQPHFERLISVKSEYPPGIILQDTLCMYAALIPSQVYARVGPFAEDLEQNDIDYSLRARQAGCFNAVSLDSVIFHFGGVSADITLTPEKRAKNARALIERWG